MLIEDLTPRQIVAELDRYIVGQAKAKRAVAIALRNRVRRERLPEDASVECDDIGGDVRKFRHGYQRAGCKCWFAIMLLFSPLYVFRSVASINPCGSSVGRNTSAGLSMPRGARSSRLKCLLGSDKWISRTFSKLFSTASPMA